jgi:hypothetical protein
VLIINKNIRIPIEKEKEKGDPPSPPPPSETLKMTFERLGEIFEGYSADTCTEKFPLMSMGG